MDGMSSSVPSREGALSDKFSNGAIERSPTPLFSLPRDERQAEQVCHASQNVRLQDLTPILLDPASDGEPCFTQVYEKSRLGPGDI